MDRVGGGGGMPQEVINRSHDDTDQCPSDKLVQVSERRSNCMTTRGRKSLGW